MKQIACISMLTVLLGSAVGGIPGKYYPGVPNDERKYTPPVILSEKSWKAPSYYKISSDIDGLYITSKIPLYPANEIVSAGTVDIPRNGRLIKVTSRFECRTEYTGTYVALFLRQFDANGKELQVNRVGSCGETGYGELNWYEAYVRRHPQAVKGKVIIQFCGNPLNVALREFTLEGVDSEPRPRPIPENEYFSKKKLSDKELDLVLAKREKVHAAVKRNGDMVEFLLNGKAVPLKFFKSCPYTFYAGGVDFRKHLPAMQKAGFNVFSVRVDLGVPTNTRTANSVWLGKKKYQVEVLQLLVRRMLSYAPDAMIMLEINVTPPPGWGEANPDDVATVENGTKIVFAGVRPSRISNEAPENYKPYKKEPWRSEYWVPSYYSEKFTADASEALQDIFAEFEKTPESKAVVGVFLNRAVDGQWFDITGEGTSNHGMADYSKVSLEHFRNYLRKRYDNDVNKLRAAWGDKNASFDTAKIPSFKEFFMKPEDYAIRHYGRDRIADFIASRAYGMSGQFASLCRAIKRGSNNRILAGGYRAEGAITSYPFFTQQCSAELYKEPAIDFFASCPGGRTPAAPIFPWTLNGSMRMRDKLFFTELDFRSPSRTNWGEWGKAIWHKNHDFQEFGERAMRAQLFSHARGGSFYAYDMDGGWFDHHRIRAGWEKSNRITDLFKPAALGSDRAALFYSEHIWEHVALENRRSLIHVALRKPQEAFIRSGVDFDTYLLDDVFNDNFEAPQILCFVTAPELTKEKAQEIRKRFGNNNRVIIWMWAPGFGVTKDVGSVAGFKLERAPQVDGRPVMAIPGCSDPLMKDVSGVLMPSIYNYGLANAFAVIDKDAVILGKYLNSDVPAMAVKRHAGFTEIYIGQIGSLTPQFIRNAARSAGIQPYTESNDPAAKAGNLLIVSAASTGVKKIHLKPGMRCLRALTPHDYTIDGQIVTVPMKYGEVLVLEIQNE